MLRAAIIGGLFLAVAGCASDPGLGSRHTMDRAEQGRWLGGGNLQKMQSAPRPPNSPASAARPEPPRTAGKAGTAPTAKPAKPVAKKCRLRDRVWQGWRWVCP